MNYEEAIAYISSLEPRGWRLGLDRMQEFANRLGLAGSLGEAGGPQYIHVAGTNGKGSTTAFLQSIFVEAGLRTGAFFSPFVVDPRERVQFGRDLIGKEELASLVAEMIPIGDSLIETEFQGVTEFEFKAGLGFLYWKRKECDWVALEVGLGGRLDATNIIVPRASIITSISLDHTSILGDNVKAIAFEKAGIIKSGRPVVIGQMPQDAADTIQIIAQEHGSQIWRFGEEIRWQDGAVSTPARTIRGLEPSFVGSHQKINLSLAIAALEAAGLDVSEEAIRKGATRAFAPGRFQTVKIEGKTVVFDGAHNSEAAELLKHSLDTNFPGRQVHLVTNILTGHTLDEFYAPLEGRVKCAYVVPINSPRCRAVEDTVRGLTELGFRTKPFTSVKEGLTDALASVQNEDIVLVTGSYYLVGEALLISA